MSVFSKMVRLLLRTVPIVSGRPAKKNDGTVYMKNGDWRFEKERSVFGDEVSRLGLYWMRAGAINGKVIGEDDSILVFLNAERALEEAERHKKINPNAPKIYHYASAWGVYPKEVLLKLKS